MKSFSALVRRAAAVCDAPIAGLALIKGEMLAIEAHVGGEALGSEIPLSCCSFVPAVLAGEEGLLVTDAAADPAHAHNPMVAGPPHIRFFAGMPLKGGDGAILGTLAVMGPHPRSLTPDQLSALADLAEVAQELLETARQSRLLRRAIDRAGDCISIHEIGANGDWPGRHVYVNDHTITRTGYTRDEIFARSSPLAFGPETDLPMLRNVLRDVRKGVARQFELPIYCKDGSHFWTEVHCQPLADEDGVVRRYVTICRDITARRDAERTMRLLSRAINEALDFVVVTDFTPPSKGGPFIQYASAPFLRATGYRGVEIIGQSYMTLFAVDNDPVSLQAIVENMEQGRDIEKEILIRRKDGSTFWVEYTVRPLRQPNGQFSHWVSVGRDISMRRQTHEQMAALVAAIDAVDRHVEIYAMENGRYQLAFQNAAVNDDTSEFVGTLLNDADIPGDTPLRNELKQGKNVIVTPDGLEIRPLDSQARTIMCIKQKAV
ncbi:MAG TPA: PAS domain-containing protein [Candidatus Baltobacteraceae bacterium]|nr:PAS domain-containing protein [Candidatus Baltobacteraceae bacterium]